MSTLCLWLQLTSATSQHQWHAHLCSDGRKPAIMQTRQKNQEMKPEPAPDILPAATTRISCTRSKVLWDLLAVLSLEMNYTRKGTTTQLSCSDKLGLVKLMTVGKPWEPEWRLRIYHGRLAELPRNTLPKSGEEEKTGRWKHNNNNIITILIQNKVTCRHSSQWLKWNDSNDQGCLKLWIPFVLWKQWHIYERKTKLSIAVMKRDEYMLNAM